MIDDACFMRLAHAAMWAPTAENRHFVRLRLDRDGVDSRILVMPTSALLSEDAGRMPLHSLGVGALVENVVLRARAEGWRSRVGWCDAVTPGEPLARIELVAASEEVPSQVSVLHPCIERRVTNRAVVMAGPALDPAQRTRFDALSHDLDGVSLGWIPGGGAARRSFLRMAYAAESARFANRGLHHEMFSGIRWNLGWSMSSEEGLPPGALGIEWIARPGFSLLRHWPLAKALSLVGGHRLVGLRAALIPLLLSADVMVISSERNGIPAWLDAGRAMQRAWLLATSMQRAVQPVAAVALYANPAFPNVGPRLRDQLQSGWRGLIGDALPMMCLRMGIAPAPSVRAGRGLPRDLVVQELT
ncbi:hypothetical protein J5J83_20295 [Azoarcus sp. L1K30]|uniref:hypothetical protein n=1 Tax=Azoarcus sp. L1K30 TaxID=2820277 RepID=UPI001B816ABB|nr:hypothetical protein [Azoarcus sp. L1K30]MBR0568470.1 hypothetical protein [Azoarcus sp. L1K30]